MPRIFPAMAMLLIAFPLFAVEAEKSVTTHLPTSPLGAGTLLEAVAGLLFVVLLILGLGWVLRRYGRLPLAGKGDVTILSAVSLGPRERAVLMQVGNTRLLVGVAPGRVQTLHVLEKEPGTEASSDASNEMFSDRLNKEIEGEKA